MAFYDSIRTFLGTFISISGFKKMEDLFLTLQFIFLSIFGWTYAGGYKEFTRAEDNCIASFAIISDIHIDSGAEKKALLRSGLKDMQNAADKLDALVINGDITNSDSPEQWKTVADILSDYSPAEKIILAQGNHDFRTGNGIDDPMKNFTEMNNVITGTESETPYYSTEVNGVPVIVLCGETGNDNAVISDAQVKWFGEEMEKASKTGMPIFVFCHHSLTGTHGLPYMWSFNENDPAETGGITNNDAILSIIEKYDNVFYNSGHIHQGFITKDRTGSYSSVEEYGSYTCINTPAFAYFDFRRAGYPINGCGYVIEVYSDKVVIRARDFSISKWCPEYDVTIETAKLPE